MSKAEAKATVELKKEYHNLEKDVLEEKIKVRALSEELENPMNVHRWRKLEGTDPEIYELITKIHTLQRRLISKTEEVVEKNADLKQTETEYNDMKLKLSRQPGPESAEQLSAFQKSLVEKQRQIKNMEGELALYQAQVNEYKYEVDHLMNETTDVKKKYFTMKKKEMLVKDQ